MSLTVYFSSLFLSPFLLINYDKKFKSRVNQNVSLAFEMFRSSKFRHNRLSADGIRASNDRIIIPIVKLNYRNMTLFPF